MTVKKRSIMSLVQIETEGIAKILKGIERTEAIEEYIWNGFDAGANKIEIGFEVQNDVGAISSIFIKDDGEGMPKGELTKKFRPFYKSEKTKQKNHSLPHGNNGYGRFAFISLANTATWTTTYSDGNNSKRYEIRIDKRDLEHYFPSDNEEVVQASSGTTVEFTELQQGITKESFAVGLEHHIVKALGWYLVLNPKKEIVIDSVKLNADAVLKNNYVVLDSGSVNLTHKESKTKFKVRYVQWREQPTPEYSMFYYSNGAGDEVYKETTRLNNQGDKFYHSVYVQSDLFDDFAFSKDPKDQGQLDLGADRQSDEYAYLQKELISLLRRRRRPYLAELSIKTADEFVKIGAIAPSDDKATPIDRLKVDLTHSVIAELYKIEPKIFANFGKEQKIVFAKLMTSLVSRGDLKDDLMKIIGGVVDMNDADVRALSKLLDNVTLSGVTRMANTVMARYAVYEKLKEIVLNQIDSSREKDIQLVIQDELWLLGEQYHIVAAEEVDFEQALRNLLEAKGEKQASKPKLESEDREKEMDVFAIRKRRVDDHFEHIVVELKRASHHLSRADSDQLVTYMQVITSDDRFNTDDAIWKFYLIGNDYASDKWILSMKDNLKNLGDKDLIFNQDNFKGYALKWSQVFDRFLLNHDYLKEQLDVMSEKLIVEVEAVGAATD